MQPGTKVGLSIVGVAFALSTFLCIVLVARHSAKTPKPKQKSPAPTEQQARREEPESAPSREQKPPVERPKKTVEREPLEDRLARAIDHDPEKPSAELFGLSMVLLGWVCFGTVAFFVVSVLVIVVLAQDVRARAPDQVPLWCLLFLFGGLFSVIFWLAARPPLREERRFSAGPRDGSDPYF